MIATKPETQHLEVGPLEGFLLALAQNLIGRLPKQPPKAETVEKFGNATLAVGRLLLRGFPKAATVQTATDILELPKEAAASFLDVIAEKIATITIADSDRNKIEFTTKPLADYSPKKDRIDEMGCVIACIGAFVERDYSKCATVCKEALNKYLKAFPFQLFVISLQR